MSETDNEKKLDEIIKLIRHSSALNGGFDKLSDAVENVKNTNVKVLYELQLVKHGQDINTKKIEDMHKALYDPDSGVYHRVTLAINANETQETNINKVKEKTNEIEKKQETISGKINNIERKHVALERIAGEDFRELHTTISTKKNMLRALWLFIAGAITGIGKILWDILSNLL